MLGNVLKRAPWKDDWASKLKRTEARWPWRLEILRIIKEHEPRFPQGAFDRRWSVIQSALEAEHDGDAVPFPADAAATMIYGVDEEAARRIAKRYFRERYHLFSWLFES